MRLGIRLYAATGFAMSSCCLASDSETSYPRTRSSYGAIRTGKAYVGLPFPNGLQEQKKPKSNIKKRRFARANSIDLPDYEIPRNGDLQKDGNKRSTKRQRRKTKSKTASLSQQRVSASKSKKVAAKESYTSIFDLIQHSAALEEAEVSEALIPFQDQINVVAAQGPPMIYAIIQRNIVAAKVLMRNEHLDWSLRGPDNIKFKRGWTALMYLAYNCGNADARVDNLHILLKKYFNLANKIFGYLARCEFWLKGYVDFLAKFGANFDFRV